MDDTCIRVTKDLRTCTRVLNDQFDPSVDDPNAHWKDGSTLLHLAPRRLVPRLLFHGADERALDWTGRPPTIQTPHLVARDETNRRRRLTLRCSLRRFGVNGEMVLLIVRMVGWERR